MPRFRYHTGAARIPAALWIASSLIAFAVGCGHIAAVAPVRTAEHPLYGAPLDGVPPHVLTWTDAGRTRPWLSWPAVAPYLDFAIVGQSKHDAQLAPTIAAAGVRVIEYTEPNRQSQVGPEHFKHDEPADFAFDCTGARIYRVGLGMPTPPPGPEPTPTDRAIYLMDPHSAHLAVSWASEATAYAQAAGAPAYIFEDTADSVNDMDAVPCGFDQTDWSAAANALDTALTTALAAGGENVSIIFNGLAAPYRPNPGWLPPALALNATTAGGMAENCYSRQPPITRAHPDPTPIPVTAAAWTATENVETLMAAAGRRFVCNAGSDLSPDAAYLTALREYVMASFLLTYEPDTSVLDEQFRPVSSFSVFPESSIVALEPASPAPSQISDLLLGGVYVRRYGACYVAATPIGPCAAVVNPSATASFAFPLRGVYARALGLRGGGVLDKNGVVRLDLPVPKLLAPASATIAYGSPPTPSPAPSASATPPSADGGGTAATRE